MGVSETGRCDLLHLLQDSAAKAEQIKELRDVNSSDHLGQAASPCDVSQCSPTTVQRSVSPRTAPTVLETASVPCATNEGKGEHRSSSADEYTSIANELLNG